MLSTLQQHVNAGRPFMEEFKRLYNENSYVLKIACRQKSAWWTLVYNYCANTWHHDDVVYLCTLFDDASMQAYGSLLQDMFYNAFRSHTQLSAATCEVLLRTVEKHPLPELFNDDRVHHTRILRAMHHRMFDYSRDFSTLEEAFVSFYEPIHWRKYFYHLVNAHVKVVKSGLYLHSGFGVNLDARIKHIKQKYWDLHKTRFMASAWVDNSGRSRYFYYYFVHGSVPEKASVANDFFKRSLYEDYGLAYNNRSRIETLYSNIDPDTSHLDVEKALYDLLEKTTPTTLHEEIMIHV